MELKLDKYSKVILTLIAIALLLNAVVGIANLVKGGSVVHADSSSSMKITDVRSTWPIKVEISNWPDEYRVRK